MSEVMTIQSHRGPYEVLFDDGPLEGLDLSAPGAAYLVDANVARLHGPGLGGLLDPSRCLVIEAIEENKSLERMHLHVLALLERQVRRGDTLVAVGGGIIQDIACFMAATLMRGLAWRFVPTTLLAQADSCVGSKSSINVGSYKNIMGTFTPPEKITVSSRFLETLPRREVLSGLGEIIKYHIIAGPGAFDAFAPSYPSLPGDPAGIVRAVRETLAIKKPFVEKDEFDRGRRNILNYGHGFGHALESATDFAVPHGIAVSLGADMANWMSAEMGISTMAHYLRMHPVLAWNYSDYANHPVDLDRFLQALSRDKKNTQDSVRLILPDAKGRLFIGGYSIDKAFRELCAKYLSEVRQQ